MNLRIQLNKLVVLCLASTQVVCIGKAAQMIESWR